MTGASENLHTHVRMHSKPCSVGFRVLFYSSQEKNKCNQSSSLTSLPLCKAELRETQNTVFSICWSTWQHCNWFGIFQTLQRLWALFPHLWESNPLPGWLSGHLANPPTRRSCVDRMKLLFLLKFVYRNTPNSWSKRGRKGHRDTFNSEIVHNNFQMLSKRFFFPRRCKYEASYEMLHLSRVEDTSVLFRKCESGCDFIPICILTLDPPTNQNKWYSMI